MPKLLCIQCDSKCSLLSKYTYVIVLLFRHRLETGQVLLFGGHLSATLVLPSSKSPLEKLPKFGDDEIDENHAENDTPLPTNVQDLESVVGDPGNVNDREDGER